MSVKPRWSAWEEEILRNEYAHASTRALAAKFGRSPRSTQQKAVRMGLVKQARELDEVALRKLHADGLSNPEISTELGFHPDTIEAHLVRMGLTRNVKYLAVQRWAGLAAKWGVPVDEARRIKSDGLSSAYLGQRKAAKNRGFAWEFTPASWLAVWKQSGRLDQRGARLGQYCMSRFGDSGPYAPHNVEIKLHTENSSEGQLQRKPKGHIYPGVTCPFPGHPKPYRAAYGDMLIGRYATAEEAICARKSYDERTRKIF